MPWLPEPSTLTTDVQPRAVGHPHVPFTRTSSDMSPEGMLADDAGDGCSGADTTQMIDDQGPKIKSDTPTRITHRHLRSTFRAGPAQRTP